MELKKSTTPKRAVLTVAAGKIAYWQMAITLARSFEVWNRENDVPLYILSDLGLNLPSSLRKTQLIKVGPGALGRGFASKLLLDKYSPADKCLFIDADCLCQRSIEWIFERFAGHAVSVVGGEIREGEWFGDVRAVCERVGVAALPNFNGAIYYLEKGPKATAVYERARHLNIRYDALGLVRLRGQPNEELPLAIAMAQEGCRAIPDDGTIYGDFAPHNHPELVELDVLKGKCCLGRHPASIGRPPWDQRPDRIEPAIVHFLGHHVALWPYRAEALKLLLASELRLPASLARTVGNCYALPLRSVETFKDRFRPMYHRFFGPRKIEPGVKEGSDTARH